MAKVFIGLGTNVGDKRANLVNAIKSLAKIGLRVKKMSSVYETEPIGVKEQDWFYNMVVGVETDLSAETLLIAAKDIEKKLGRKMSKHWGPRLIDIDLLMYEDLEIDKKTNGRELKLPHDELLNRAFVLEPLLEIEPETTLPDGRQLKDFLQYTKDQKVKKLTSNF